MECDINELLEQLDFDNYDYFYHQTEQGNGEPILEEGLYVKGDNIINTDNLLFTTAAVLFKEDVKTLEDFINFLEETYTNNPHRHTDEMVIIGIPKHLNGYVVTKKRTYLNGEEFQGIISSHVILGYIDIATKTFILNENYDYIYDIEKEKRLLK